MAKKLTSDKAKEILHDKSVHGHPLTDKQRKFFGAIAGGAKPYAEDGGWLSKYEQGGLVLKKKTKDNYDLKANPNDVKASVGPNFVGLAYDTTGRNYSPAWGGQFEDGGILGKRFLQPNDPKLPKGWNPESKGYSTEYSTTIGKDGEYYLVPGFKHGKLLSDPEKEFHNTGEMLGGPFKTIQSAEDFANRRHKYVEQGKPIPSPLKTYDEFAMGGSLPGATGFMYARVGAPSNGPYAKKTKASAEDGKTMPKSYWKSSEQREEYRNKLKEIGKKALQEGSDESFLLETPYHKLDDGNNCINGVCGLNRAAGLQYSNPVDQDRYLGNTKFSDAVKAGKEDYYQVSGNFQVGDHIQYLNEKGAPHHSKMIYDITTNDKGDKEYHVIHNSGGKTFTENIYSEADMKDMLAGNMPLAASNYSKINVYRPGYTLDKPLIDKEREAKTSPEAREALVKRKELQDWDATHNPGFEYSIRPESEYYKNQPEGMKKFIEFANDDAKVTELAKKLNVGKDIVHDQLLNTFGELGQENKWADRWFGGTGGIENTFEKIFSPKNMSIGPGQIKFKTLDPELKEKFGIKKAKDLHDIEKVIPLMTAINVRNKQYMERQGEDLSTKLIGIPGTSADEIKYGVDRWVPYMYRGPLSDPSKAAKAKAEANASEYRMSTKDREDYINNYVKEHSDFSDFKTFDKGSYAERVYDMIDKNLARTMPAEKFEQYNELMPITVKSKKKMVNGGEMEYYQNGLDWKPKTISEDGTDISKNLKKQAEEFLAKRNANRNTISQYTPKAGEAERLDKEKLQRIEDSYKLLNRAASSKGAKNLQDAIEFAAAVEGGLAVGKAVGKGAKALAKQTYKINPWAEKLMNPNMGYRIADEASYQDFMSSGYVRPKSLTPEFQNKTFDNFTEAMADRPTSFPSFAKGEPAWDYLPKEGKGYIYATEQPLVRRGDINPITGTQVKGRHWAYRPIDENTGKVITELPYDKVKVYSAEPHWLKGYQEVAKPTGTSRQLTTAEIQAYNQALKRQFRTGSTDTPPEGLMPYESPEYKKGGWLNKYK